MVEMNPVSPDVAICLRFFLLFCCGRQEFIMSIATVFYNSFQWLQDIFYEAERTQPNGNKQHDIATIAIFLMMIPFFVYAAYSCQEPAARQRQKNNDAREGRKDE